MKHIPNEDKFCSAFFLSFVRHLLFLIVSILALAYARGADADSILLQWTPALDDSLITGYEVHYGPESAQYQWVQIADTNGAATDTDLVDGLLADAHYCFAVRSRNDDGSLVSAFSNEICTTIEPPDTTLPVADFTVNAQSGSAPFTATFYDTSLGEITGWLWNFGDGGTSTAQTAVYTYSNEGTHTVSLTVTGPDGSSTETKTDYITVTTPITVIPPPVADFSVNATSGDAPLTIDFTDASSGTITTWAWDFGDGSGINTVQNPQHTYSEQGIYTVGLTVSGPDGTDSEIKSGYITVSTGSDEDVVDTLLYPQLEVGEAVVDYQWQWIAFDTPFGESPVVVAKPLSAYDSTPATVRIRNIDSTGFEIRVQEWEYLSDAHGSETVFYLAMESGNWELDDGTRIAANRFETDATTFWESVVFAQTFGIEPVVLAAVTTQNGTDAVISRLREIDANQFEVRMYEQEANSDGHAVETISYIAWEPSSGALDGVPFEVGATGNVVKELPYAISYQSAFPAPPKFLADMQTTDGGDTSNLRWRNNSNSGVEVWVQEEKSEDWEIRHTSEVVGYMSFGQE